MGRDSVGVRSVRRAVRGRVWRAVIVALTVAGGIAVSDTPSYADELSTGVGAPRVAPSSSHGAVVSSTSLTPPRQVCGKSGNGEVIVTWTAPSDSSRVGFVVEHRVAPGGGWQSAEVGDVRTFSVSGANGVAHEYRVAARDGSGNRSEWGSYCLLTWDSTAEHPVPSVAVPSWPFSDNQAIVDFSDACILASGGELRCDGESIIAAGVLAFDWSGDSGCALEQAGTVACWGSNTHGKLGAGSSAAQSDVPLRVGGVLSSVSVSAVSVGAAHACAVTVDGRVACWGYNGQGQIGNAGVAGSIDVPVWANLGVLATTQVVSVSAGYAHNCAQTGDGRVVCWGWDQQGQLGNGVAGSHSSPPVFASAGAMSGISVSAVVAGMRSSCAITTPGGQVVCWGTGFSSVSPTLVTGGPLASNQVTHLDLGEEFACAVTTTAELVCWGLNHFGHIGVELTFNQYAQPATISSGVLAGRSITGISASMASTNGRTCALADGRVACWGAGSATAVWAFGSDLDLENLVAHDSHASFHDDTVCAVTEEGQLFCSYVTVPDRAHEPWRRMRGSLENAFVTSVSVGDFQICAVTNDNKVACWDITTGVDQELPQFVTGGALSGASVDSVAVGQRHVCAVTGTDQVVCWGRNDSGQIGDGSVVAERLQPVAVDGGALSGTTVSALSAGPNHTCAVTAAKQTVCWGRNASGQVRSGGSLVERRPVLVNAGALFGERVAEVGAGASHTCALTTTGKAVCWGDSSGGATGNGGGWNYNLPSYAVGGDLEGSVLSALSVSKSGQGSAPASCAVTQSGSVVCWGANLTASPERTLPFELDQGHLWKGQVADISAASRTVATWAGVLAPGDSPTPPRGVAAFADGRAITTSWDSPVSSGATDITEYLVEASSDVGATWPVSVTVGAVNAATFTVPRDDYWITRVTARNQAASSRSSITADEILVRSEQRVVRANMSMTFLTTAGQPVSNAEVTWRSTDNVLTAVNAVQTSPTGVAVFPALATGPVVFTLSGGQAGIGGTDLDEASLTTVIPLTGAVPSVMVPDPPSVTERTIIVKMPNLHPVGDVTVSVDAGLGRTATTGRATSDRTYTATWRHDDWPSTLTTDANGMATISGFVLPTVGSDVTATYSDGVLRQRASGPLTLPELTLVFEQMPFVDLPNNPSGTIEAPAGEPVEVTVRAVDGNGDAMANATLELEAVAPSTLVAASDMVRLQSSLCTPQLAGVTSSNGVTTLRLCPQSTGTWRVKGESIVASRPLVVRVDRAQLTVTKAGTGSGQITSAPAGLSCGSTCTAAFNFGASVTLTAAASSGSTFTGWSGSGCGGTGTCTVTMSSSRAVTATFTATAAGGGGATPPPSGGGGGSASPPSGGGGGGGGAPIGGGGGGASSGGGSSVPRGEPVTAAVSPSASRSTPTTVELLVPAGRVELRLTGLTRAAEASVTVIDPPETRGITFLPTAFDIEVVTAGGLDRAELCVPVDADEVAEAGVDAQRLSLFHFDPTPVDITTRSSATEVCGVTSSFSPFAVGVPATSRVAGTNRYDTAARLVAQAFPSTVEMVLVATGANFPDALAASAAAANADAPLLLVTPGEIPAATRAQIVRLRPQRIVIVGGVSAVNAAVEAELGRLAPVERIAGTNRYDTAARLATRFFTPAATSRAYVVNGDNFPDALAAGAASSYTGRPVLLTQTRTLPAATSDALDALGIQGVTIVGGDNAVAPAVASRLAALVGAVDRVAGVNRYDTATRLANTITNAGTNVLMATGTNFPDALGAAAVAARLGATLILTTPAAVPTQTTSYLNRRPPTTITILGGTNAITRTTETQLATNHLR